MRMSSPRCRFQRSHQSHGSNGAPESGVLSLQVPIFGLLRFRDSTFCLTSVCCSQAQRLRPLLLQIGKDTFVSDNIRLQLGYLGPRRVPLERHPVK